MSRNLTTYSTYQVFLNYPFDDEAYETSISMHFAVVAAGLLPVCARDFPSGRTRIQMLGDALANCQYSAHDFSRLRGEGDQNLARFNMPLEMGMALYRSLQPHSASHHCAFFVPSPFEYLAAISDLRGLDPLHYQDPNELVTETYGWLTKIDRTVVNPRSIAEIQDIYYKFRERLDHVRGGRRDGRANHDESQELMYEVCTEAELWDWRKTKAGQAAFPPTPYTLNRD